MKKLMFAIAAVAAGTVLADVTSANIVGYKNTVANDDTAEEKYNMLGCAFANIVANGTKVTDLCFTGYHDIGAYKDALEFSSRITIINSAGVAVQEFMWYEEFDDEAGDEGLWLGGYWKDAKKDGAIVTEENAYVIPTGAGLWCPVKPGEDGKSIQLVCAGQVIMDSKEVVANSDTEEEKYAALCNPLARAVNITEVRFTGYHDIGAYKDALEFSSRITVINSAGTAVREYMWYEEFDDEAGDEGLWLGGYWKDMNNDGQAIVESDNIELPAGQGLWCPIKPGAEGQPIKIQWPKCFPDAK